MKYFPTHLELESFLLSIVPQKKQQQPIDAFYYYAREEPKVKNVGHGSAAPRQQAPPRSSSRTEGTITSTVGHPISIERVRQQRKLIHEQNERIRLLNKERARQVRIERARQRKAQGTRKKLKKYGLLLF